MTTAKELMAEIIRKLNTAGYTGGFYFFKKDECSCCYGRMDKDFFQVNENIPSNWFPENGFYYKISYNTDNKEKATKFRKSANKLARKAFGKMADTAISNAHGIIIQL